jgi:leucyl/phenylalanyl-tRNA--protein transferase
MAARLTPSLVLHGYRLGAFPMADPEGVVWWYSPDPRAVLDLDQFHIPHGLRRTLRRRPFDIRIDTAFEPVIDACGDRHEGTWISPQIRSVYCALHRHGHAHSVECWQGEQLAGGLYGVAIGGAFFGESMFHRVTDASKVALVALVERLRARGFVLLDTQWTTPHLEQFGIIELPREEYLRRLADAVARECAFADGPTAG